MYAHDMKAKDELHKQQLQMEHDRCKEVQRQLLDSQRAIENARTEIAALEQRGWEMQAHMEALTEQLENARRDSAAASELQDKYLRLSQAWWQTHQTFEQLQPCLSRSEA